MLERVKGIINKHGLLSDGDTVVAGLSGGADSCALVSILSKLCYRVIAVHVNHGIRGSEAERDEAFARTFCQRLGIEFYVEQVNVPLLAQEKGVSLETAAREARYAILYEYAQRFNCPIAVAHNQNDQAETVLMHLLRGSGLNGLCGMKHKSNNIIRPLLDISREEIEAYDRTNNIDYVFDSTNSSTDYTRNMLRLKVIPLLNEVYGQNTVASLSDCAEILSQYNDYILMQAESLAKQYLSQKDGCAYLKIAELPDIINIELIKKAITVVLGNTVDIERTHFEAIIGLMQNQSGRKLDLPHGLKVVKEYDLLIFSKSENDFSAEYAFIPQKSYLWDAATISSCFTDKVVKQNQCEYLDFDLLPNNLKLRTRQAGDYIFPLGSSGKCTLKKYLIDKKIPASLRNKLVLLASESEIYAIIGYTVSEKAKVTDKTKNIIKIFKENQ